jgi:outer membrane protein assembly factor BamB
MRLIRVAAATLTAALVCGADWRQFMKDGAHTGNAADEALALPLAMVAQIKLGDVVMTSPAVVGERVYVVDQMGAAYCVEPLTPSIVWRTAPDGDRAMGSNTSSPCVAKGRVYYGTTAGTFHVLDAKDGRVVKTLRVGAPIISSPTFANDSIYVQALDAVVRCLDLDGNERWRWDHYRQYREAPAVTTREAPRRGHPGSYDRPHYGGGEVAVSGTRLVTSIGWDLVSLDDRGDTPALAWCRRCPAGRDGAIPMSSSISNGFVYTAGMGADGVLALMRFSLADGSQGQGDSLDRGAFPWITPAVRGDLVTCRNNGWLKDEFQVAEFGKRRTTLWQDPQAATPVITSHALAKDHLVVTTLGGECLVIDLAPKGKAEPFRFKPPNGGAIGSSPAVAGGRVYFGCDDGYLYVLGPGEGIQPLEEHDFSIREPRGQVVPATGRRYPWPSTGGTPGNTSFVDDPALKPPLALRWAVRGFGHFKAPVIATEEDVISVTLGGTVTCLEQSTGRLRWRRRLPPEKDEWPNSSGLLAADGRLYVPRPNDKMAGTFHCLDIKTGDILWTADIGGRGIWERASAVFAARKVAFAYTRKGTPPSCVVQAWDAETGKPAWQVELNVAGNRAGSLAGTTDGQTMYFTAGAEAWQWKQEGDKQRGETVAIDAATGAVRWRSNERFGVSYPVLAGDRLLLAEYGSGLHCVSAKDGKPLWTAKSLAYFTRFSIGADYLVARGYGGSAMKVRLEDGKEFPGLVRGGQLGGETHACGAVALTPNYSFAVTVGGLNVRDAETGALLWLSPGFAPRGCVNATLANGRVFFPAAANGTLYCWEPQ